MNWFVKYVFPAIFAMFFAFPIFFLVFEEDADELPIPALIVCGVIVLVALGIIISNIIKDLLKIKLKNNGQENIGYFIGKSSGMQVNGAQYFAISYIWKNKNGETINAKSGAEYLANEVNYFERKKAFKIRTLGKSSIIWEKPFESDLDDFHDNLAPKQEEENYIECEYCGNHTDKKERICPCCGTSLKRKK
ncbi:MAG: hypothetical protein J6C13_03950 [Clostridia bacterium]|nr:hypothetical protein [Clostridia bacterium]